METDECTSECCLNATAPYQPDSPSILKLMKQKDGSRFRSLNPSWYKEFSWLHVCTMRKKVFCYYCLKAYSSGLITVTDTKKMAFFQRDLVIGRKLLNVLEFIKNLRSIRTQS